MEGKPELRRRPGWLLAVVAVAAAPQLLLVNDWPGFASPNERARAYQAMALVGRGELTIDRELERLGDFEDVAVGTAGRYPNKAPGLLPLVVPAAAAARLCAGGDERRELQLTLWLGRWLASAVPFLLCTLLLDAATRSRWPAGGRLAVVTMAVASPALVASLLLFSHALSACLLLAGALLVLDDRGGARRAALGGLLLGWAATSEYQAAAPGLILVAAALPRLATRTRFALVFGGGVPMVALAAYNAICFGSPLALSSGREAHAAYSELAARGVFGVSWPTWSGLAGQLFSPSRGLLVWVPVVVAMGWSLPAQRGKERGRCLLRTATAATVAILVAMSGYPNWHGGWFAGPRYLVPVLPLALLAAAPGLERALGSAAGRIGLACAGLWGAVSVWPLLASFPFPPEDYPLPAFTLGGPLLRAGVTAPSWLPPPVSLAGLVLAFAGAAVAILRAARVRRRESAAALAIVALLVVAASTVPAPVSWKARLERAVIEDVYAGDGRARALERLRGEGTTEAQRAQVDGWIARRLAADRRFSE